MLSCETLLFKFLHVSCLIYIQFSLQYPSITLEELFNKSLQSKRHCMIKCNCQRLQIKSNQMWIYDRKLIHSAPQDLIIFIVRTLIDPITRMYTKMDRQITLANEHLILPFIETNFDEAENELNTDSDACKEYETCNVKNFQYTLIGTAHHKGQANSGHYINNIRNDNDNPQTKWVQMDNETVNFHNNFQLLSHNLIACWFQLQSN